MILFFRRKMKDDLSQKNTWKYDIFFKCSEKMVFPKKSHWNMIFLVLSGKMIFLFPENMILFFRRKMKDNLYQKKYMEIWYFLQMPLKDSLSKKKNLAGIWSFLYYLEKWCFFPENMIFFLWTENGRWSFSRNTWKYDIFCIGIYVTNMVSPFCKKNQRWSSPGKIHLQVTDILDHILERVPTIPYTFMETFIGVFICCFPVKKTGNLMCRIEIWLLLQFIWLEIIYSEESPILCTIQPSGVVFRGVLEL